MTTYAAVTAPPGLVLRQLAAGSARALGAMAEAARVSERDVPEVLTQRADWAVLLSASPSRSFSGAPSSPSPAATTATTTRSPAMAS